MKILLTGATGYIGKRLLPVLIEKGHKVIACTRDKKRLKLLNSWKDSIEVLEVDFLKSPDFSNFPQEFDAAYYLVHSMSATIGNFEQREKQSAENFKAYMDNSQVQQIIYLTGIVNEEEQLSSHLKSRLAVEKILDSCKAPLTALRAGIVVGSGSASFEIIRDLTEKLPIMITPSWLNTKCQPIGIRNVIEYLTGVLKHPLCLGRNFDISSGEILTYKEILLAYAKVRKLKRYIFTVPVMTPRLSSYWLYFVTSISYPLAVNLVNSMKVNIIARNSDLQEILKIKNIPYEKAVEMAFQRIQQNMVVSSWKDSFASSLDDRTLEENMSVPEYGCFKDKKSKKVSSDDLPNIIDNIWSIGGERGWYYGNYLWRLRGFFDKLLGGVGLRRGRTHADKIDPGDALDFWRVLVADKDKKRLLLYAEMILPGDAWLEFQVIEEKEEFYLKQIATFRPDGVLGRLYWFSVLPFHYFVFNGMIKKIIEYKKTEQDLTKHS